MVKTVYPVGAIRKHRMVVLVTLHIDGFGERDYGAEFDAAGNLVTIEQWFGGEETISLLELAHEYVESLDMDMTDELALECVGQMLRRGVERAMVAK